VKKILTFPGIAAFGLWSSVHAEGGCPPSQYPQQGQGWQTCVPIPGEGTQQQATPPAPQWVSQWQAIATDKQKAVLGASMGKSSSVDSENAAISDCRSKGGVDCEIQISYRNGCVSMVIGDATMNTQGAGDQRRGRQCGAC
jgi:hypothetical protein